jgi:hypothetical protein
MYGSGMTFRPGTKTALFGAGFDLMLAAGIGVIRATHGSVGQRHAEGSLPTLAIAIALAAPGVLALVGIAINRPILFGAAGFACGPLIVVSVIAFPFLIASALLILAFIQAQTATLTPLAAVALIFVTFPVSIAIGLRTLIFQTREFTYTYPGGSEGGEYFTPAHAVFCIALVAAGLVFAATLAQFTAEPVPHARRRVGVDSAA